VQRALDALASSGKAQSFGQGRARRWIRRRWPDSRRPCYSPSKSRRIRMEGMKRSKAEIVREYGPFPGAERVNGVTYDGEHAWFASGDKLNALDPSNGKVLRSIDVPAHAGTAFDGRHLYQIADDRIQRIDPESGRVLATIPGPAGGGDSGSRGPKERCGSAITASARSIRSIRRPAPSFAPSSPIASSPVSHGSMASCGTQRGRATKATCDGWMREPERCWKRSRCSMASTYRGSHRTARIGSSAAAAGPRR